jgi:uncharacterized membrane protein YqiK
MSVYRDDLTAARERIRALEQELQSIQRREATTLQNPAHDLVQTGSSHTSTAIALVGVLITGFVALRVPTIAPVAVVAVLLGFVVLALRGRSIVVRPNEVAVVRPRGAEASALPPVWVGPGRVVRLRRGADVESLSLRAVPVSWTAHDVTTADGRLDIDLFAVVAVRRDEEGIERAVRTFGVEPIAPITQAALEDALRHCVQTTASSDLRGHDAGLRDQLRRRGRESLEEFGVKLVSIGTLDVRAHHATEAEA